MSAPTVAPGNAADENIEPARVSERWSDHFRLAGGIALYFYQPTNGWKNQFLIYSNLRFDARWQTLGVHFEPRLSNEKLRPYFDGLAWIQEAYVFWAPGAFMLKAGKTYKRVGLFWDNSFYGNIQVYEGLKFDPNSGLSLEGKLGERLGVEAWAQYFVIDGHTNASLSGRDTISIPGARRRDTFAGRLQPFAELAPNARLELGLSAETFRAELPAATQRVRRLAADVKLTWGGFGLWGEVLQQNGANVTDFPYPGEERATPALPGRASADNLYLLAGSEYSVGALTLRYNLSLARYRDVAVDELLHLPSVALTLNEQVSFLAEYASWRRHAREGTSDVDESLNLTLIGRFD